MAVWDQFLTEQDKQHLAAGGAKKAPFGFGVRPVLLMIDVYYGALGDKPEHILDSVQTWPRSCGAVGWEAVYKMQELLRAARANRIPVTYVTGMADFPHPWNRSIGRGLTEEQRQKEFDIVEDVAPMPGELVLRKAAPSGFFGTLLAAHLVHLGADTIIACGETTSGCVRATVVDGVAYRYRMGLVEECTFDRHQASHAINLFDMHQKYADVINLAEATAYFEKIGGRR
ncbi:MAG: isochorismatase family protein [Chloroflexi bacterium]|nr:isochorismatase family protein [Chloroflexota bacterium]